MALDYAHIRSREVANTSRVDFYKDGERYYAFERSAWFVSVLFKPDRNYQVLSSDGIRMVYYSFSEEDLENLLQPFKTVTRTKDQVMVSAGMNMDIIAFYKWRDSNRTAVQRSVVLVGSERKSSREMQRLYVELWAKVDSFDIENASDENCRELVLVLKDMVNKASRQKEKEGK
ncbi:MAG: hypothetical protein IJ753_07325 [Bacteroidales bacterium]|nr:hypothetical protein [Bacteroidales bacterium]